MWGGVGGGVLKSEGLSFPLASLTDQSHQEYRGSADLLATMVEFISY